MQTYYAIIFDLFGTLIDTGRSSVNATREILQYRGRTDLSPALFYADWRRNYRIVAAALKDFHTEAYIYTTALAQTYRQYNIPGDAEADARILFTYMTRRRLYPGTHAVLESLQPRYRLIIGSNSDHQPFQTNLEQHAIRVDAAYCSEDLQVYKPHPHFYTAILDRTGLDPGQILWVGDTFDADVEGPLAAGMHAAWLNRQAAILPAGYRPTAVISSLTALQDFLAAKPG